MSTTRLPLHSRESGEGNRLGVMNAPGISLDDAAGGEEYVVSFIHQDVSV
ncbi:hypothetical protein [Bacteroides caecimuris]|nr:hypothetical protein [Bacteroides caecimuris]